MTCVVADDKGQTAAQTTQVTVAAAAVVAAKAETSALCSISFQRDLHRPSRVNNEAKACLDEIALGLQRSPDTTLAIIGNTKVKRSGRNTLAAQRAVNTKAYLVKEKGIDASRIKVYTGIDNGNTVTNISVPLGATLSNKDYILIDERHVKPSHHRHVHRKARSTAARHKASKMNPNGSVALTERTRRNPIQSPTWYREDLAHGINASWSVDEWRRGKPEGATRAQRERSSTVGHG